MAETQSMQPSTTITMTYHDSILGQWSAYAYNGYGTMEDEQLVFLPDQTGWYAFDRGVLYERITFTWSIMRDGVLTLDRQQYTTIHEGDGSHEYRRWTTLPVTVRITLREETTMWPDAARHVILSVDPAPFAGSLKFALINSNPATIVFPRFPYERT
jgi:hypothetical protein